MSRVNGLYTGFTRRVGLNKRRNHSYNRYCGSTFDEALSYGNSASKKAANNIGILMILASLPNLVPAVMKLFNMFKDLFSSLFGLFGGLFKKVKKDNPFEMPQIQKPKEETIKLPDLQPQRDDDKPVSIEIPEPPALTISKPQLVFPKPQEVPKAEAEVKLPKNETVQESITTLPSSEVLTLAVPESQPQQPDVIQIPSVPAEQSGIPRIQVKSDEPGEAKIIAPVQRQTAEMTPSKATIPSAPKTTQTVPPVGTSNNPFGGAVNITISPQPTGNQSLSPPGGLSRIEIETTGEMPAVPSINGAIPPAVKASPTLQPIAQPVVEQQEELPAPEVEKAQPAVEKPAEKPVEKLPAALPPSAVDKGDFTGRLARAKDLIETARRAVRNFNDSLPTVIETKDAAAYKPLDQGTIDAIKAARGAIYDLQSDFPYEQMDLEFISKDLDDIVSGIRNKDNGYNAAELECVDGFYGEERKYTKGSSVRRLVSEVNYDLTHLDPNDKDIQKKIAEFRAKLETASKNIKLDYRNAYTKNGGRIQGLDNTGAYVSEEENNEYLALRQQITDLNKKLNELEDKAY
ncbi:MAG: hypothetical protein PHC64_00665 [Candidatus Gastranaerophilales bacterium]|nr:hypothetical protein [Candidatus Gastranaerophilales bacterium]